MPRLANEALRRELATPQIVMAGEPQEDRRHRAPSRVAVKGPTFGAAIDRLRRECGWSLEMLAEKVSFDRTTVIRHVSGKAKPRVTTIKAYADIFTAALSRSISPADLQSLERHRNATRKPPPRR
jgi:ribosome-binding protein aMBF1 (putative translation factor)